jgi:hypothetical protein
MSAALVMEVFAHPLVEARTAELTAELDVSVLPLVLHADNIATKDPSSSLLTSPTASFPPSLKCDVASATRLPRV